MTALHSMGFLSSLPTKDGACEEAQSTYRKTEVRFSAQPSAVGAIVWLYWAPGEASLSGQAPHGKSMQLCDSDSQPLQ